MSESMIVGVDHGYAAMKTAHFSFPSGLVAYEHEPYTLKDVLEYGGKFYVVGSGRQALQKNKTQTEDYYLLTLAAIAKELSFRHAEPAAEIHLAAGLPLTSFGREKNAFREYLLRVIGELSGQFLHVFNSRGQFLHSVGCFLGFKLCSFLLIFQIVNLCFRNGLCSL